MSVLFVIGGDGTLRGAQAIADAAVARGMALAVVGVPKTIDNDIPYIDHSFGFQTAFARAADSIRAAHTEAASIPQGVGLVKLMGRHSGFITCYAALANHDTDFVLIPEVPFALDGPDGFLACLRRRVERRGHAVVVVAEGAGQELNTTSMLPRVALEYGQTWCAASASRSAVPGSAPGIDTLSTTARPYPPPPIVPMLTSASTSESSVSTPSRRPTTASALWKQAA